MAKYGVGIGEEFPVDEAAPPPPQPHDSEPACGSCGPVFGWFPFAKCLVSWVVILGLVMVAVSLFEPYRYHPAGFYPYPHHFFFPFFPVALIVIFLAFAWRRGGRYRRWRHWHDEPRGRGPREEA